MNDEPTMRIDPLERIASMARKAQEHRRNGRTAEAERVQSKADALALATLREHPFFDPECTAHAMGFNIRRFQERSEAIKRALDGEDPPECKPNKFSRVLEAASLFFVQHKRLPSASELREMGVHPTDVADVAKHFKAWGQPPVTLELKRGRKSNE